MTVVVIGGLLGFLASSIPSPQDPATFWVGNYSSPWAVLAFLAGWSQRSRWAALVAGVGAEIACVTGFYGRFLFAGAPELGLPSSTPIMTVVVTDLAHWLGFVAPWMVVGFGAGALYGLLGRWWGESRAIIAGIALAAPFIAEPALWPLYLGFSKGPVILWVGEIVVGCAVFAWVVAVARRPPGRDRGAG